MRRAIAAVVAFALVTGISVVAEPPASAAELAAAARAEVLEKVRDAAWHGDNEQADADPSGKEHQDDGHGADDTKDDEPASTATLNPGAASTLASDALGLEAVFSGYDLDSAVSLALDKPEDAGVARRSVAAETGGVAVSDVVEITATDGSGVEVTSFPAQLIEAADDPGDGPTVVDVVPGITLDFDVDLARVKEAGVDPSTLRIYTRENAGEAWAELPSYFDKESGSVKGESTHLSEFVVIGTPFPVPPGPKIVLDPDNDEANVQTPAPATEFPYNWALVDGLKSMLEERCNAQVVVTRPAGVPFVSRSTRAGVAAAANPVATVGFGFNAWQGFGWGTESEGGTLGFSRGGGADNQLRDSFVANMPTYTGRPAEAAGSTPNFPFTQYSGLPGAYAHVETLFLDHNYDRPVIDNGFTNIVNGAFRSLGGYLEGAGFDCTNPVLGGWPSPPSQAELARWRHLGYQNYQTYGADPVSFSTGNLVESIPLFTLPGVGDQVIDATLVYNSQDGRLSRVGAGWTFGLGARAQRFDDGSVLAVRGDGASFVFTPDGSGGFVGEAGTGLTLTEAGLGQLRLEDRDGAQWLFDAADIDGIGELASYTDPHGATLTFTYGPADRNVHQFVPLTRITDDAGQAVTVTNDAVGRITGFTLPDGRTWALAYDGAGNLVSITDAGGGIRSFTYDGQHRMLTATDALGVEYLVNEYDNAGRVVKQWDADGNERRFAYNDGETVYTDNEGNDTVFAFDDKFRITGITNPAGDSASWRFDDEGNVTEHTDEAGRTWQYAYDDAGNMTEETDPSGAVTSYTYTPDGDVATVTDALERTTVYTYDDRGLVTRVDQPDGTTLAYTYTADGDLATAVAPSGATTRYAYDSRGNLASITDPLGRTTTYAYDTGNRLTSVTDPAGGVTRFAWDAADRLVSTTDPVGAVTRFGYDRNGNLTTATDPVGAVTRYTWDDLWRVVTVTAADGGETRFEYDTEDNLTATTDPEGATTQFVLDEAYRTVDVVDPNGGHWQRTVDSTGIATSATDPLGAVTSFGLDDLGRTVTTTDATGVDGLVSYDAVGRIATVTDSAGGATKYTYDALDRVTKVTDQAGFVTEFAYDIDGNLVGVIDRAGNPTLYEVDAAGQVVSITGATGAVETYEYDAAGRVTAITDADGNTTTFAYDAAGRTTSVTDPLGNATSFGYDAAGRLVSETNPLGAVVAYQYDVMGQLVQVTDPTDGVTGFAYDLAGRQTSTTNPLGVVTAYEYDPAGQLVRVVEGADPDGEADADTNVVTAYTYTPAGLLAQITGPTGAVTGFAYDAAGRVTRETGPTGITTTTSYDDAGRVDRVINGAGLVGAYAYDARSDVSTLTRADGEVAFEYDAEQRPIAMTDPTGVTGWVYDEVGRMLEQLDSNGNELTYAYSAAGLLESLTYPDQSVTAYTYDAAGRPVSQTTPEGDLGYTWDAASQLTEITRPNQVTTTLTYDLAGRTTSVVHATPEPAEPAPAAEEPAVPLVTEVDACRGIDDYLGTRTIAAAGEQNECVKTWDYLARRTLPTVEPPAPAGASLRYDYTHDAAGNVTTSTRTLAGPEVADPEAEASGEPTDGEETETDAASPAAPAAALPAVLDVWEREFGYDDLARLTSSTSSTGEVNEYGYDPAGNRTSWTQTGAPTGDSAVEAMFNAAGQLTGTTTSGAGAGSASYAYDAAGNRSSVSQGRVTTQFAHDPAGRLMGTSTDGRSTTYAYDGLDRQVSTTDATEFGTDTTQQSWDGLTPVFTDSGLHGDTSLFRDPYGDVAVQDGPYGAEWLLGDQRNTTATTDSAGQITDLVDFGDFGDARYQSTGWGSYVGNDGQPGDATLGVDQYYARNYDPSVGSWLEPDDWRGLLTQPQTLNRHAYVTNNPATYSDLLGYLQMRFDGGRAGKFIPKAVTAAALDRRDQTRIKNMVNANRSAVGKPPVDTLGTLDGKRGGPAGKPHTTSPYDKTKVTLVHKASFGAPPCIPGSADAVLGCLLAPANASVQAGIASIQSGFNEYALPALRWLRNLPLSIIGGAVGGIAALNGGRCDGFDKGLLLCSSSPWKGTITLGNVVITSHTSKKFFGTPGLVEHESSHTVQSAVLGNDLYAVLWLGGLGASILSGKYGDPVWGGGCLSPIELTAAPGGGYEACFGEIVKKD